jgi:SAM-dependent methyltransferase
VISQVYQHALYYDIAFGFVDAAKSVDLLEAFIKEHSGVGVRRVLDICCGPSVQLREFARRGYRAIGLDSSQPMLDYLTARAREEGVEVETVNADMHDSCLPEPADFCFNLMGSMEYAGDNSGIASHLASVARALRPGGLYLIENLLIDWNARAFREPLVWEMERDGVIVKTTYRAELKNALEQTVHATLELDVDDHGQHLSIADHVDTKLMFPQEFRAVVELSGGFDFVGYFERDSTLPLRGISQDNTALLRRRNS